MTLNSIADAFQTLDAAQASGELDELLERVSSQYGRVQIISRIDGRVCVLISKTELDSLEHALQILSDTEDANSMRQAVEAVASLCSKVPVPLVPQL